MLKTFVAAGFHGVGFSPMLSAPTGEGEMQSEDLELMLGEMIDCGQQCERASRRCHRYCLEASLRLSSDPGTADG
jgi:uncharacterized protein